MKKKLRTWEVFDVNGISLGTVTAYSKYHARSEAISKIIEAPIVELQECIGNDKAQKIIAWKSGIKHG